VGSRQVIRYLSWTTAGTVSADLVARVQAALPDVTVTTEHTSGSLVILSSIQHGKGDFGFSYADVAYTAYRRGMEDDPYPHTNLRAVGVRWVIAVYAIVSQSSGIRTLSDLKGKRVGVVPKGSAAELLTRMMLDASGLRYSDIKPQFLDNDRLTEDLREGSLDAVMWSAPALANVRDAIASGRFRVLSLAGDIVGRLRAQYPFIKVVPLEAALTGSPSSVTVGVDSILVCRADLEESIAYVLAKSFYAQLSDLARTQPDIDPENASATPIPLHPGAARFYREEEILNES
jgi:TRAP transporter TAXI family solute receptor